MLFKLDNFFDYYMVFLTFVFFPSPPLLFSFFLFLGEGVYLFIDDKKLVDQCGRV
jgi:hypothetical protein